jgi:hypothetical protein
MARLTVDMLVEGTQVQGATKRFVICQLGTAMVRCKQASYYKVARANGEMYVAAPPARDGTGGDALPGDDQRTWVLIPEEFWATSNEWGEIAP